MVFWLFEPSFQSITVLLSQAWEIHWMSRWKSLSSGSEVVISMQIIPVILSGGAGTRLWPVSRSGHPKQLQELCGLGTLLQQTAKRLPPDSEMLPPVIICNNDQRFIIAEQLRETGIKPSLIVLEPMGRSTAPALTIPAIWTKDPEKTILVAMPADHFITDNEAFQSAIRQAAILAYQGKLMTLGIKPTAPHTGYGYIEIGESFKDDSLAHAVARFKEKPDAESAAAYVASGNYLWNSGIFVFRADIYLAELERLHPRMVAACRKSLHLAKHDYDFLRLDSDSFSQATELSVDYAVMEKTDKAGVLPVNFGWNDIGGWTALWNLGEKDEANNVICGDVVTQDVKNSYIRSEHRLVAALGLENMVIVETADALLVANRDRTEEVRDIVKRLREENRYEEHSHERVWRPWGYYEKLDEGERFQVKLIMVKPDGKLSLQLHHHRAEHWVVVSGTAKVTLNNEVSLIGPNETAYIPLGTPHRLENPGKVPLFLIEVQSGDYLDEDDILRYEDVYRRVV